MKLLDAATLTSVRTLTLGRQVFPYDLSFSPDGRRLAVGGDTGLLYTFTVADGRPDHEPAQAHGSWVGQVEWLPDNRTVVSAGDDRRVVLYDADTGLVGATLPVTPEPGTAHTYLTEVRAARITALSGEQPARRYPLNPQRWLDRACSIAARDLTRDEWSTYLPGRPYQRTCGGRA